MRFSGLLGEPEVAELASLGVTHILIHVDQLKGRREKRSLREWLELVTAGKGPPLQVVREAEDSIVLRIEPGQSSGEASVR